MTTYTGWHFTEAQHHGRDGWPLQARVAELEKVFDAAQELAWAIQERRADQVVLNAYLDVAEAAARPVPPEEDLA